MTPTKAEVLAELREDVAGLLRLVEDHRKASREAAAAYRAVEAERDALVAERDALQSKVQEMALQALADDTQSRELMAERDALLEMLKEARQMVFEWGSNAQDLFDLLPQDLARIDAAIDAAMKGTK